MFRKLGNTIIDMERLVMIVQQGNTVRLVFEHINEPIDAPFEREEDAKLEFDEFYDALN